MSLCFVAFASTLNTRHDTDHYPVNKICGELSFLFYIWGRTLNTMVLQWNKGKRRVVGKLMVVRQAHSRFIGVQGNLVRGELVKRAPVSDFAMRNFNYAASGMMTWTWADTSLNFTGLHLHVKVLACGLIVKNRHWQSSHGGLSVFPTQLLDQDSEGVKPVPWLWLTQHLYLPYVSSLDIQHSTFNFQHMKMPVTPLSCSNVQRCIKFHAC